MMCKGGGGGLHEYRARAWIPGYECAAYMYVVHMCVLYVCMNCYLYRSFYGVNDSFGECGVPHERRFPMPRPSLDKPW